jgi:hypothetical protein
VVLPLEEPVGEDKHRSEVEFDVDRRARYVAGQGAIGCAIRIVMFTIFLVQMGLHFRIGIVIDARPLGILASTVLVPQLSRLRLLLRKGHGEARWGLFRFQFVLLAVAVELSQLLWLVVLAGLLRFLHLLPLESSFLSPLRPLILSLHGFVLLWHALRLFMVLVLLVRLPFLLLPRLVFRWRRLRLLEWCRVTSSSTAWFIHQRYDQVWVIF